MALVEKIYALISCIFASDSRMTMFFLFCTFSLLIGCTKAQRFDDLILAATDNNEDIYDKAYRSEILPLNSLDDYQLGLGASHGVSIQVFVFE